MGNRTKKTSKPPVHPQDRPGTTHFDAVDVPAALASSPPPASPKARVGAGRRGAVADAAVPVEAMWFRLVEHTPFPVRDRDVPGAVGIEAAAAESGRSREDLAYS